MIVLLFLLGIALLLLGASGVINSSLAIASKIRISPLIVGITAVALGTSLPEITVALFGGIDNAGDLAMGNIIGSNIANIGLIFGLSILIDKIRVGRYKTQRNLLINLLLSIFIFFTLLINKLTFYAGVLFIFSGIILLWLQIKQGLKGALLEDKELLKNIKASDRNVFILVVLFIISLITLAIGGKLSVDYGVLLAQLFKIPQAVIGVTAVAVGTSLPELAVSIIGLVKKQDKLVIGNILGSNIFNILFGAGVLGLFNTRGFGSSITLIYFLVFSLIFSLTLYIFKGKNIPQKLGLAFLFLYGFYVYLIFV
jgi:cation:H+ antiporter